MYERILAYTLSTENGQFKDLVSTSAETPKVVAQAQARPVVISTNTLYLLSPELFQMLDVVESNVAYKMTSFAAVLLHSRSGRTLDLPSYPELHHNVP
jgi:hypothetical protein